MTGDRWERIQKLFAAALERPPEERPAYVREHAEDPVLRSEVLSLLEAYEAQRATVRARVRPQTMAE